MSFGAFSASTLMPPPPRPGASAGRNDFNSTILDPPQPPESDTPQLPISDTLIANLITAVKGYQSIASYCLGGSIPISTSPSISQIGSSHSPKISLPITLRFDSSGAPKSVSKVILPQSVPIDDVSNVNLPLQQLISACSPATFGSGGRDVLDETYRKAGKLDRGKFSTDFHPHDFGIIDAIAQGLLPGRRPPLYEREEHLGVRAELYKLNIYAAPSGLFKENVDTPRGVTQFGSLVVCLPSPHQGGELKVSHKGHTSTFDWSNTDSSSIKWVAFYSDCEHEVLPVTSGHRITLTYNLFVSEQVGGLLQRYPSTDPELYPLFESAKKMLEQPEFLKEGGKLGFHCAHTYAHTRKVSDSLMPYSLKGIDSVIFSVFNALDVTVTLRPMLGTEAWDDYEDESGDVEMDSDNDDSIAGESTRKKLTPTRVGRKFQKILMVDKEMDSSEDPGKFINQYYQFEKFKDVLWLNSAIHEGWEIAMVNLKYGNEASLAWQYSHAAIFVDIPPIEERKPVPTRGLGSIFPNWHSRGRGQ